MDRFVYRDNSRVRENKPIGLGTSLFNNAVTKILLLVISTFLLYNVVHSINITVQKLDIHKRARIEIDSLRLKNLELALSLENMQSVEYLEIQARDRLNFAGEKEYVFVIPEKVLEGVQDDVEMFLKGDEKKEERSSYEIWKNFLMNGI
jgi:cell division protein FtsB